MKLSAYAKLQGISYATAWRWWKAGVLNARQMPSGTIIVTEAEPVTVTALAQRSAAVYARVSSAENKTKLDAQAQRVAAYCAAKGYHITTVVKEIGSGLNDERPKLMKLLTDATIECLVVEHKDRLTRFGWNYIERLLALQGRRLEVINEAENGKEDLIQDFVAVITSFCARLYGPRRSQRKTEKLVAVLRSDD